MRYFLIVHHDGNKVASCSIAQESILIGSDPSCDIVLNNHTIHGRCVRIDAVATGSKDVAPAWHLSLIEEGSQKSAPALELEPKHTPVDMAGLSFQIVSRPSPQEIDLEQTPPQGLYRNPNPKPNMPQAEWNTLVPYLSEEPPPSHHVLNPFEAEATQPDHHPSDTPEEQEDAALNHAQEASMPTRLIHLSDKNEDISTDEQRTMLSQAPYSLNTIHTRYKQTHPWQTPTPKSTPSTPIARKERAHPASIAIERGRFSQADAKQMLSRVPRSARNAPFKTSQKRQKTVMYALRTTTAEAFGGFGYAPPNHRITSRAPSNSIPGAAEWTPPVRQHLGRIVEAAMGKSLPLNVTKE